MATDDRWFLFVNGRLFAENVERTSKNERTSKKLPKGGDRFQNQKGGTFRKVRVQFESVGLFSHVLGPYFSD